MVGVEEAWAGEEFGSFRILFGILRESFFEAVAERLIGFIEGGVLGFLESTGAAEGFAVEEGVPFFNDGGKRDVFVDTP